jgi:hypothetical protein
VVEKTCDAFCGTPLDSGSSVFALNGEMVTV